MNGSQSMKLISLSLLCSITAAQAMPSMQDIWSLVPSKSVVSTHVADAGSAMSQFAYQGSQRVSQRVVETNKALEKAVQSAVANIAQHAQVGAVAFKGHAQNAFAAVRSAAHGAQSAAQVAAKQSLQAMQDAALQTVKAIKAHPYIAAGTAVGAAALIGGYWYAIKSKAIASKPVAVVASADSAPGASSDVVVSSAPVVLSSDSSAPAACVIPAMPVYDEPLMMQAAQEVFARAYNFSNMTQEQIEDFINNEVAVRYEQLYHEHMEALAQIAEENSDRMFAMKLDQELNQ